MLFLWWWIPCHPNKRFSWGIFVCKTKKMFFSLGLDVGFNNLRDIVALVALLESHLRRRSCDPEYICRTKWIHTSWVGLMVKNMCFLLRGHKFKSRALHCFLPKWSFDLFYWFWFLLKWTKTLEHLDFPYRVYPKL